MLELRFIRENIDLVKEKCARRGMDTTLLDEFIQIDKKRLATLSEVEGLKNKRNTTSNEIAVLKRGTDEDKKNADPLIAEMKITSQRIKDLDLQLNTIQDDLQHIVMAIPNLCDDDVPVGQNEEDNIEIRKWGEKPTFSFEPKPPIQASALSAKPSKCKPPLINTQTTSNTTEGKNSSSKPPNKPALSHNNVPIIAPTTG